MTDLDWLEAFPQWPVGGLGLERMHALLELLDHPERRFDAVHVVGTKGKSTAARRIAALLRAEGRRAAAYTSPHVAGWWERLETDEEGFLRALARVRPAAEEVGASQFETLTAAAFADFAARGVETAAVEAGVGGRLDATNVLDAGVVLLTNVGLEHTDLLGETREAIAAEKLAVAGPQATVVLPDEEFAALVPRSRVVLGGTREAAAAALGRPVRAEVEVRLPGRLDLRADGDVWDGAHTPDAVDWLLPRLPHAGDYALVVSVLDTKDVDGILERLRRAGSVLVATRSSHERALPPDELARRAGGLFATVETAAEPRAALDRAREHGRPLLVTGSLYLLADLMSGENTYDVAAR
jgi:dihydrofolate synthase / folylpolyglutamate synthase